MEPHNADANRIVLFMATGLILIMALAIFRAGGPMAPLRRSFTGLRNHSSSFDIVIEAAIRIVSAWRPALLPLCAWLVQFYVFYFGSLRLSDALFSMGLTYESIFPVFLGLNFLQGVLKGLILFWFIRIMMEDSGDPSSQRTLRVGSVILAVTILVGYITGFEFGILRVADNIAYSVLDWDISVLISWVRTATIFATLPFAMFAFSCFLVLWIPQISIGRPARFGPFIQRTLTFSVWLTVILLIVSLLTSLVLVPVNSMVWTATDVLLGYNPAVVRGWIIDGLLRLLTASFLLWQLAIIVTVSERARLSITGP